MKILTTCTIDQLGKSSVIICQLFINSKTSTTINQLGKILTTILDYQFKL